MSKLAYYSWKYKPCPRCGNKLTPAKQKIDRYGHPNGRAHHYIICKKCGFHSTKTLKYRALSCK